MKIIGQILTIRNNLYDSVPTGRNIDSFELIGAIKAHLQELDKLIDELESQEKAPINNNWIENFDGMAKLGSNNETNQNATRNAGFESSQA